MNLPFLAPDGSTTYGTVSWSRRTPLPSRKNDIYWSVDDEWTPRGFVAARFMMRCRFRMARPKRTVAASPD
jgi:hypothetical protein